MSPDRNYRRARRLHRVEVLERCVGRRPVADRLTGYPLHAAHGVAGETPDAVPPEVGAVEGPDVQRRLAARTCSKQHVSPVPGPDVRPVDVVDPAGVELLLGVLPD